MKNFIAKDGVSDADLMHAARDMYDALEWIFAAWYATKDGDSVLAGSAGDAATAALAKARGQV